MREIQMKIYFRNGTAAVLGIALMIVSGGSWLAAAAPGKEGASPISASKLSLVAALASTPELPVLSDPVCQGDATCEGVRPMETQMLALVNA